MKDKTYLLITGIVCAVLAGFYWQWRYAGEVFIIFVIVEGWIENNTLRRQIRTLIEDRDRRLHRDERERSRYLRRLGSTLAALRDSQRP